MRLRFAIMLVVAGASFASCWAQESISADKAVQAGNSKNEPKYDQTFSGLIVEVTPTKITVSRSILGKPAEKRAFWIKPETRVEGKLRLRAKVTVGYVTTDDGEVARLVVVRAAQKASDKK